MVTMSWAEYFFKVCSSIALKSKDPSTKIGSVIVGPAHEIRATGYNGFPRGVFDYEERYNDREKKYSLIVHSELNAILAAARNGVSLDGCTLYCQWIPCHECAKAIIQVGIIRVIVSREFIENRGLTGWEESFELTKNLFKEAGVIIEIL